MSWARSTRRARSPGARRGRSCPGRRRRRRRNEGRRSAAACATATPRPTVRESGRRCSRASLSSSPATIQMASIPTAARTVRPRVVTSRARRSRSSNSSRPTSCNASPTPSHSTVALPSFTMAAGRAYASPVGVVTSLFVHTVASPGRPFAGSARVDGVRRRGSGRSHRSVSHGHG